MRILQVCHHFRPCVGGVERHVEDLCKNLIERGHESDAACLDSCANKKETLPHYEEYKGIKISRLPFIDLGIYKIAPGVLKLIKKYDVIHVHGLGFFSDFLAITSFFHRKPLILTTHGGIFHTHRFSLLKKVYFNFWCRLILKKFRQIIAVSKNDEALFSRISPRVTYVPNGVDIKDFPPTDRKTEKNSLLFVGRLSKNKGIDNLIKMIYFLKKEIPDVKLYVVGEDWEDMLKDLKKMVEELELRENVFFVGAVKDRGKLLDYYLRSQIFVSASQYEGFGISVLEAMASGRVVAVNDIDAFKTFIENGENGFIVDYSNPKEAALKIAHIMNTELSSIRARAKERSGEYDWKKIIEKIEKIYEGCLE
jgi:alpha-1,3-mannosyltransferase